jgi:hypothetical protein
MGQEEKDVWFITFACVLLYSAPRRARGKQTSECECSNPLSYFPVAYHKKNPPTAMLCFSLSLGIAHELGVEPIGITILLDYVCATRYRLYGFAVRIPPRRARGKQTSERECSNPLSNIRQAPLISLISLISLASQPATWGGAWWLGGRLPRL